MLYLDLLPRELTILLMYYLPFDTISRTCTHLTKWSRICSDDKFWRSYIAHTQPYIIDKVDHINKTLHIPFKLLADAPLGLIMYLDVTPSPTYEYLIAYDYLPIFLFYFRRCNSCVTNGLYTDFDLP